MCACLGGKMVRPVTGDRWSGPSVTTVVSDTVDQGQVALTVDAVSVAPNPRWLGKDAYGLSQSAIVG